MCASFQHREQRCFYIEGKKNHMREKLTVYQPGCSYPDPHLWLEPAHLLSIRFAVFEGLFCYDEKLNVIPLLAENWEASDNAQSWTFTLREGILFHDGSVMTARDVAASIRNATREDISGALGTGSLLYMYLGQAVVSAPDERHVRIELPEPMADICDLLVYIMIIPEKYIGKDPQTIPGTGPFRFGSIEGNRYTFTRFAAYRQPADVEKLVFVENKNPDQRLAALLNGEADIITPVPRSMTPMIEENDNLCLIQSDSPVAVPLMLNCFEAPFTDVRVRQAVNYATDVDEIIRKVCDGKALPLTGPLTRNHFGADPEAKPYPYDPAKAKQLLTEAGYGDGLKLTMFRPTILPDESPAIAKLLKEQWQRVGIRLEEAVQPNREQYAQDVKSKKIRDFCIFDSAPASTYRVLHEKLDSSRHGPWWQGYSSDRFNTVLAQAVRTVDTEARRELYRQAIQIASDEAAWCYLYMNYNFSAVTKAVKEEFPALFERADGVLYL